MAEKNQLSSYYSKIEKINNPTRIAAILKNILEARTLLRVTLPGSPTEYNSTLLDINRKNDFILLDELNPKAGHKQLLQAKKLAMLTRLNNVDVSFAGHLQQTLVQDDIAIYKVQLPKLLYYRQLRAHFRIPIGITEIPVNITLDSEIELKGELHDISAGGICIRFAIKLPANLKRGILINSCVVDLPEGNQLKSKLEVRFRGSEDDKGRALIGGQFVKLDQAQQRMLERYIASLDREIRRKS